MNLGERSTQSLPTLLRRDSLQAEMGLFAFSGSAHGRNKKDVTIFESEESLRQVQLAATRV